MIDSIIINGYLWNYDSIIKKIQSRFLSEWMNNLNASAFGKYILVYLKITSHIIFKMP